MKVNIKTEETIDITFLVDEIQKLLIQIQGSGGVFNCFEGSNEEFKEEAITLMANFNEVLCNTDRYASARIYKKLKEAL